MIYSRLLLARNLLSDDGVIFISIDDGEVGSLREICDEIFGMANFIADLIWQKKFSRSNDATYFSTMHNHILCYCKKNILTGQEVMISPQIIVIQIMTQQQTACFQNSLSGRNWRNGCDKVQGGATVWCIFCERKVR
jgi:hypothetical protein